MKQKKLLAAFLAAAMTVACLTQAFGSIRYGNISGISVAGTI